VLVEVPPTAVRPLTGQRAHWDKILENSHDRLSLFARQVRKLGHDSYLLKCSLAPALKRSRECRAPGSAEM
jgi:hypothetical protein